MPSQGSKFILINVPGLPTIQKLSRKHLRDDHDDDLSPSSLYLSLSANKQVGPRGVCERSAHSAVMDMEGKGGGGERRQTMGLRESESERERE